MSAFSIKKTLIPGKGYGMVATKDIKVGEIIIVDKPITLDTKDIYSDIFQLLYKVLSDDSLTKKFLQLTPKTIDHSSLDVINVKILMLTELNKIKKINKKLHTFFVSNYTQDELVLYCTKYMCNAFSYKNKPSFLFIGTLLNHSCLPNTVFVPTSNDTVSFICVRSIKKGDEVTDNYVNITDDIKIRKKRLLEQYGFDCQCERCVYIMRYGSDMDIGDIVDMKQRYSLE